jgi:hypothetical protein
MHTSGVTRWHDGSNQAGGNEQTLGRKGRF